MGFFKKAFKGIGKTIKKNVSFKNLVKTVGQAASFVPGVGGIVAGQIGMLQDKHYAKKEEAAALAQLQREEAEFATLSKTQQVDMVNQQVFNNQLQKGVPLKDVLQSALGGAFSGAGVALAGDTTVSNAGASLVDSTMMAYLKKNWMKLVGIITAIVLFVWGLTKFLNRNKRGGRRR